MLTTQEKENIQKVWAGLDAILIEKSETGIEQYFAEDFIQHNPWAGDTIIHLKEMLQMDFGYKGIRWVSDGDIMAYHGYYTAPNPLGDKPLLCTDVWRFEDGKIQEHWDALKPVSESELQNAISGAGNGELNISEEERTANRLIVKRYLDHVLNRGRLSELEALVSDNFIYHDEIDGEVKGRDRLQGRVEKEGGKMLHDNKLLLASGDLVLAHSHFFGTNERVVFDWYRLEDQKITDQWSVSQAIEPWENVANNHPHF